MNRTNACPNKGAQEEKRARLVTKAERATKPCNNSYTSKISTDLSDLSLKRMAGGHGNTTGCEQGFISQVTVVVVVTGDIDVSSNRFDTVSSVKIPRLQSLPCLPTDSPCQSNRITYPASRCS